MIACYSPLSDSEYLLNFLAGMQRIGGEGAAEEAWGAVGLLPAPKVACLVPKLARNLELIEFVSVNIAKSERSHRGLVRVWRITKKGRQYVSQGN